jgi:hypothetical protein
MIKCTNKELSCCIHLLLSLQQKGENSNYVQKHKNGNAGKRLVYSDNTGER